MTTMNKKKRNTSTPSKKGGFDERARRTRTIFHDDDFDGEDDDESGDGMMIWSLGDIILTDDMKDDGRTFRRRFRRERREAPLCLPLPPPRRIRIRIITTVAAAAILLLNTNNENTTNNNNEFILYGSQGSRSPLINWYLYEKEVQFELKEPRDVSNPHPFGQVPALRHKENVELFESGAILLYLADKCGELKSDEAKANAYSWVLWANASLDPICFKEDINGRVIDTGIKNETKGMRRLDDVLSKREWLSGDQFGVADVAVAAYLLYVPQFFQGVSFKRWPNVAKFMGRCCSRDSYAKAFGPRVQSYLIGELMKDVDGN